MLMARLSIGVSRLTAKERLSGQRLSQLQLIVDIDGRHMELISSPNTQGAQARRPSSPAAVHCTCCWQLPILN